MMMQSVDLTGAVVVVMGAVVVLLLLIGKNISKSHDLSNVFFVLYENKRKNSS